MKLFKYIFIFSWLLCTSSSTFALVDPKARTNDSNANLMEYTIYNIYSKILSSIINKPKQHCLHLPSSIIIDSSYLQDIKQQQLISYYIKAYLKGNELAKLIKRAKPLLDHIITALAKKKLPKELALLPIVESAYRVSARSSTGATGIWQISYVAGKRYGLINCNQKPYIDLRSDLTASTNAALAYLDFLYKRFNNDWLLALAAYNAGEGRISKAIARNQAKGLKTNYINLILPKETYHYIPKLLALAIIFNNPQTYGLNIDNYLFNNYNPHELKINKMIIYNIK